MHYFKKIKIPTNIKSKQILIVITHERKYYKIENKIKWVTAINAF